MSNTSDVPTTVYELVRQSAGRFGAATALTYLKEIFPEFLDELVSYSAPKI